VTIRGPSVEDLESVEYSPSLSEGHGWRAGRWDYPQRARGRGLMAALMALGSGTYFIDILRLAGGNTTARRAFSGCRAVCLVE
jgi:hypothetical protein